MLEIVFLEDSTDFVEIFSFGEKFQENCKMFGKCGLKFEILNVKIICIFIYLFQLF